jgi:hypothetical protein
MSHQLVVLDLADVRRERPGPAIEADNACLLRETRGNRRANMA